VTVVDDAGGFAATLDEATVTGGTTALGGPGATSLNGLNAALRRPTASGASPQLPRLAAMEQIAIHIQKAVAAGKDQVTIQLRPEDLGRIDVKLELGADGQVKAHVRAEKPETLELLQRDARGLERALQDAGLRADTGSLSFGLRGENRGDGQGRAPAFAGAMPQSPDAATETIEPHVAARAMDGRVDLHV